MTVKEPPRGYTDPPETEKKERAGLKEAIHELMGKPAFWLMTAGATIAAFCGYGISSFQSLFLVRTYEITAGQAAIWINTRSRCRLRLAPLPPAGWRPGCTKNIPVPSPGCQRQV
ncbi:hypothetical protein ULG90_04080 [Halopseudomonas pachastrellae]|nr:hypothetical protein ULG90_04080 [Halopseudomonas pachastrellae]